MLKKIQRNLRIHLKNKINLINLICLMSYLVQNKLNKNRYGNLFFIHNKVNKVNINKIQINNQINKFS